eukprot:1992729-Heterocapsa_arctica.AAC.1
MSAQDQTDRCGAFSNLSDFSVQHFQDVSLFRIRQGEVDTVLPSVEVATFSRVTDPVGWSYRLALFRRKRSKVCALVVGRRRSSRLKQACT